MPLSREPSLGELADDVREIRQDLKEGITNLTLQIRDLNSTFGKTFVRRDLYEAEKTARDAELRVINTRIQELDTRITLRVTEIEKSTALKFEGIEQKATNNWRLGLTALVFPAMMVLFTLILTRVIG